MSITKNLLLAAFSCCIMSVPTMFGAALDLTCPTFPTTITQNNATSGSATFTCGGSGLNTALVTITNVQYFSTLDWSFGGLGSNTETAVFTPSANFSGPTTTCVDTATGTSSGTTACSFTAIPSGLAASTTLTGPALQALGTGNTTFTVLATATVAAGSSIGSSNAGVMVEYDYNVNQVGGAPEPTTFALLGSALVGLGILGRKRLSR